MKSRSLTQWMGLSTGLLLACTGNIAPGSDASPPGTPGPGTSSAGAPSTPPDGSGAPTGNTGSGAASGMDLGASGGASSGASSAGSAGTQVDPGSVTAPPTPFDASNAFTIVRKVKMLLTGLAPTDADVQTVTNSGAAGLQGLINTWMTQADFQDKFRDKMLFFFRNAFQQTGFIPTEDFKPQLLENGGFDFGNTLPGDDIFPRLVQNLEDSFALTTWGLVAEGRPFTETLTTQRFMLTTALKSLYLQVEMPREARGQTATPLLSFKVDESGVDIPLEQALDPSSPSYLTFADVAPTTASRTNGTICRGTAGMVNTYTGYARLFQVLLGFIPNINDAAGVRICQQHSSRPYFTQADVSDWKWVTLRPLATGETQLKSFEIPSLRTATELGVKLPRVGFHTTPAFLALWNTNDSNQHRVTANQALLVALGKSFVPFDTVIPISATGLDAAHSVDGSECYGCHKSLDPMRQFWAGQFDFNDRNDFPARGLMGGGANPRPATTGGVFAFGNVNAPGANLLDFGSLILSVQDSEGPPVNRFALAVTQKLCFYANSTECLENDPEFRRIALAFQASNFNFPSLIKEFFASPLVTNAVPTTTTAQAGVMVSIARRDQLCEALSNRLGRADLCAQAPAVPSQTQAATAKIASSVASDGFSRGSEAPVTPTDPTLFYAAATEMLCENIAAQVVDAATDTVYASSDPNAAMADMVERVMGYPPSDPHYAGALQVLKDDYAANLVTKATATNALRSTFSLACQSPTTLSVGL